MQKKILKDYTMIGKPSEIVRTLRSLELSGLKFISFITLTFRHSPTEKFRGVSNAKVKRICRTIMTKYSAGCVFLAMEDRKAKMHFHLATDIFLIPSMIKIYWPAGYVWNDRVLNYKAVKHYMLKDMRDSSDNYRLYFSYIRIRENQKW